MTVTMQVAALAAGETITAQLIDLVGPKGYIHGWIFVGVPAVGDTVTHPHLGQGTVTGHTAARVSVRFDSGEHSFEHADRADGQAPRFVSRDDEAGAFGRSAATLLGTQIESDGSAAAAGYRSSLHHVPGPFLRALKRHGTRIILTKDPVGVSEKDLADQRPRGYPEGKTWKDSSGAYRPGLKRAVVGNTVGSGSTDVALHETSHAIDHALGYPSRQPAFISDYRSVASVLGDDLKPYYGSAHGSEESARSEFLAETMAAWMKNEQDNPVTRADEMIAAVAPAVSAAAVRRYTAAAVQFPDSRLARYRAVEMTLKHEQAQAAMEKIAAGYREMVSETGRRQGQ